MINYIAVCVVSPKGQKISKGNCGVFNSSKKLTNVFLISALASKMGRIKKRTLLYYLQAI